MLGKRELGLLCKCWRSSDPVYVAMCVISVHAWPSGGLSLVREVWIIETSTEGHRLVLSQLRGARTCISLLGFVCGHMFRLPHGRAWHCTVEEESGPAFDSVRVFMLVHRKKHLGT